MKWIFCLCDMNFHFIIKFERITTFNPIPGTFSRFLLFLSRQVCLLRKYIVDFFFNTNPQPHNTHSNLLFNNKLLHARVQEFISLKSSNRDNTLTSIGHKLINFDNSFQRVKFLQIHRVDNFSGDRLTGT